MKKKIIISFIILLLAVVAFGMLIAFQNNSFQDGVRFSDDTTQHQACYPINGGMIMVTPDVRMFFDSTSPVSTINGRDIAKLEASGVKIDSVSTIFVGLNPDRKLTVARQIYIVALPAPYFDVDPTRSRCTAFFPEYDSCGSIENVKFIRDDSRLSRLGMDFIERFAVEYSWGKSMIILLDSVPDEFQKFADMHREFSPIDVVFSPGPQYFLDLEVDGRRNDFFIDTTLPRITINVPEDDGVKDAGGVPDPYRFRGRYVNAVREPDHLVLIGARAKYQDIHRSSAVNKGERYFCNPLNMVVNDVVLDFPSGNLLIRRGSRIGHNPGFGLPSE